MLISRKNILLLLFATVTALVLWFQKDQRRLREVEKREGSLNAKVLLPPIEAGWEVTRETRNSQHWAANGGVVKTNEPHHFKKTIFLDQNDQTVSEEDDFHFENDGINAYRLVTKIWNTNPDSVAYRFICYYRGKYPPVVSKKVTKDAADSIFAAWGLPAYFNDTTNHE